MQCHWKKLTWFKFCSILMYGNAMCWPMRIADTDMNIHPCRQNHMIKWTWKSWLKLHADVLFYISATENYRHHKKDPAWIELADEVAQFELTWQSLSCTEQNTFTFIANCFVLLHSGYWYLLISFRYGDHSSSCSSLCCLTLLNKYKTTLHYTG